MGAPAGAPVLGTTSTEASDELTTGQRVIRNQILTRSAPIAGRGLIAIGAAAVAIGTRRSRRKQKRFSVIDKKTARKTGQYRRDTVYYKRKTLTNRALDIGQQEKIVARRNARPPRSSRALKAGGAALMIGGKALPILAYGYIGYDLYRRRAGRQEVEDTIYTTTFGRTPEQTATVNRQVLATGHASLSMGKALSRPILRMMF